MLFSSIVAVVSLLVSSGQAFQPPLPYASSTKPRVHHVQSTKQDLQEEEVEVQRKQVNKKKERWNIARSPKYHKSGFKEFREKVDERMERDYKAPLVESIRSSNNVLEKDGVRVHLAEVSAHTYESTGLPAGY